MAQDILITPGSGEPQILFRGSGTTDTAVELNVLSSYQSGTGSGTALLFEGTEGQLFGITDNLSSGTIFSVSDITGLPIIEVNSDGQVILCEYGSGTIIYNDLIGSDSLIHISGVNLGASGIRFSDGTTQTTAGGGGGGVGSGLPYSSGDYYLQEIRTNSASGIAISGWAQAYVDAQDHSAVDVSGSLQPQITQNADDISDVSGLLYSSWTIADADGVSEDVFSGTNITFSGVGQTEVAYNTSTNVVSISGAPDTGGDTSALEADLAYISGIAVYGSGLDQYLLNPSGGSGITITSDPDYVVFSVDDSIARVDDLINHTAGSGLTLAGTEFNVYGGSGQFIDLKLQSDGIDDLLTLTSTDDGSSAAPVICTMRDSASPADGDYLGQIKFKGRSDTATERVYAKITGKTLDVTNGTEDGLIEIAVRADGANKIISRLRNDGLRMVNDADIYIEDNGSLGVRVSPSYSLHVRDDAYIGSLEVEDDLNIGGVATFDQVVNLQSGVKTNINTETDAATITFDMDQSNVHMATLEDNRTLAVSNVDVGQKFLIRLKQDGTGSRTATWFNNIQWSDGGTTPTLTTTEHKADLFGFLCTSGGFYDGFICGQNI